MSDGGDITVLFNEALSKTPCCRCGSLFIFIVLLIPPVTPHTYVPRFTCKDLPPAKVLDHWRQSFSVEKLITNTKTEKYLDGWLVLKTQLAYELISYDFEQIHKSANLPLQEQFDKLFDKVFCLKHGCFNSTDSSIATFLKHNNRFQLSKTMPLVESPSIQGKN
ncbi:unnamed protein product [Ceutorhynchus assimilis]|uniref:Uncharacterized protein n=1 Tax=Ceutorhynchus assimilis TaxID=467358 RepID=A0A9N9MCE7_9CUCU|nr:unnamed protein product [Ceutorhynchus assimilis]